MSGQLAWHSQVMKDGQDRTVMSNDRDYITKEDLRYEMDRLNNDVLGQYAKKTELSELKIELVKLVVWLMMGAATIATSAIVIIEHFTG